jgi:hypothetical protein
MPGMRSRGASIVGAALVLALGACGSEPSASRASHGGTGSARVTSVGAPASSTTYGARTEAVIDDANADGLVAAAGAVWVKSDDGRVVRIDPSTNAVTDTLQMDQVSDSSHYCQGIGADGSSVWACATRDDGTGVAQIDPGT